MPTTSRKQLAVIDARTGTVLCAHDLYVVEASEKRLEVAYSSDSEARLMAQTAGVWVSDDLLRAIVAKNLCRNDIQAIADVFGFDVQPDDKGRLALYTSVTA